jgi:hypothetical protein
MHHQIQDLFLEFQPSHSAFFKDDNLSAELFNYKLLTAKKTGL